MNVIYRYLLSSMETEYETVQTLKRSARGCVLLVQNRQNGARFLFRDYQGSGEVYRKLLTEKSQGRAIAYAVTANICSAALGLWLIDPLWHFIVSIS